MPGNNGRGIHKPYGRIYKVIQRKKGQYHILKEKTLVYYSGSGSGGTGITKTGTPTPHMASNFSSPAYFQFVCQSTGRRRNTPCQDKIHLPPLPLPLPKGQGTPPQSHQLGKGTPPLPAPLPGQDTPSPSFLIPTLPLLPSPCQARAVVQCVRAVCLYVYAGALSCLKKIDILQGHRYLFWSSDDIGFKGRVNFSLAHFLACMLFLRFTSGATPADLSMASMAANHIPHMRLAEEGYRASHGIPPTQ